MAMVGEEADQGQGQDLGSSWLLRQGRDAAGSASSMEEQVRRHPLVVVLRRRGAGGYCWYPALTMVDCTALSVASEGIPAVMTPSKNEPMDSLLLSPPVPSTMPPSWCIGE